MGSRFPRVGRLRRGYHPRQVDAFLNQVEVSLSGVFPPPTASDVRQVGFELVHRGYDTQAVDSALDALEERVHALPGPAGGRRGRLDTAGEAEFLRGELSSPYMKRFPRSGWRRGYDVDDVDEFVDQVVAALDGRAALTLERVRRVQFRPRRGGYAEDAVDFMLDRVVEVMLLLGREPGGPAGAPSAPRRQAEG